MKYFKDTNNNLFGYESDGSQDHLIGDKIEITESERDEIIAQEQQSEFNSQEYSRKRLGSYPSIGDQLDDLFKAGAFSTEMAATIQAVKDKYPKE